MPGDGRDILVGGGPFAAIMGVVGGGPPAAITGAVGGGPPAAIIGGGPLLVGGGPPAAIIGVVGGPPLPRGAPAAAAPKGGRLAVRGVVDSNEDVT